jgi:sugar lactone lactonase YvrE
VSQASPIRSLSSHTERAPFITHDAAFGAVLGEAPRLARVLSTDAHEGPVYIPGEDALYVTTLPTLGQAPAPGHPSVWVKRIALDGDRFPLDPDRVSTVREDANVANGMALDLEGRLLACEQGTRSQHAAVTRIDPSSGSVETLVDQWGGKRLNSPNDVVVKSVVDGHRLGRERLFCVTTPGFPDGIKVDADGHVYASSFSGVQAFAPNGDLIGEISLPGAVNFTFGGPDRNVLFITADDAVWAAVLAVTGPSRVRGV